MANEISYRHNVTGSTLYAILTNAVGAVWNGSSWELMTVANWSTYVIALTETPTGSYWYLADFPAVAGGIYRIQLFVQGGGSPEISDGPLTNACVNWSGSAIVPTTGDTYAFNKAITVAGVVNTVTSNSDFTLTSEDLSSNNNDYNGMWLVFTSGSNAFIPRVISTYTGATKRVQFTGTGVKGAFPQTAAPGDTWQLLAGSP